MSSSYPISRRDFLKRLGLLGSLAMTYPVALLAGLRASNTSNKQPGWANEHPWKTIAAVQETLFPPGEDVPGASDINAIVYLHRAIENPDADGEDREFIYKGVGWLNDLTQERHTKDYLQLSEEEQEKIVHTIVQSRSGRNWVSLLLTYILEALLADPVYGGNPKGIGWQWLEHQPGFPTPPADKTWDRLLQRRYKA